MNVWAQCTCNGSHYIEEQLSSIARRTSPLYELVISVDGSENHSEQVLERSAMPPQFSLSILARSSSGATPAKRLHGREFQHH